MGRDETEFADRWLGDLRPTPRQRRLVLVVAGASVVGFGALVPFAGKPLSALNALIPALDAIVAITDLITAVLLFAQFKIFPARSLFALATGYLFTTLIVVPHALTISGAFSASGLLGAGIQTGSWLYLFWHVGFAASLLAYATLSREEAPISTGAPSIFPAVACSVAGLVGLVCGLTWLATTGSALLPPLVIDNTRISPAVTYYIVFIISILAAALAVFLLRRQSVLNQWLMVVCLVSILELVFSGLLPSIRFSLGFYAGRILSVIASSIVLIVLLAETIQLYARLARSNAMLRREQDNKLMNLEAMAASISHEIKQPLSSILTNSEAAMGLIRLEPPDLEEAISALKDAISAMYRTDQMIDSIRALFGKAAGKQELVDVSDAVLQAQRAVRAEMARRHVRFVPLLATSLPPVLGHRNQLQEVVLNLFHNAMEAMDEVEDDRRVLTLRTAHEAGNAVVVEVEDTGPGVAPEGRGKIFDAFVTTKPNGMGLGLAICRAIIDRHGGHISVAPAHPNGSVFRIVLPRASPADLPAV
jgi:signal transduction histidine kinase